jgi:hypothetical protein
LIIGAAGGVLGTRVYFKKKYEDIADDEIDRISDWYAKKVEDIVRVVDDEDEFTDNAPDLNSYASTKMNPEKQAEIKEKLVKNYEQTTNYANMFKNSKGEEVPYHEDPENVEGAEDLSNEEYDEYLKLNEKRAAEYKKGHIKIISEDDIDGLPGTYDIRELFFYAENDVITDENDVVIEDYERYIGDSIDKFDFRNSDEKKILVKNPEIDTVYEIRKYNTAFEG